MPVKSSFHLYDSEKRRFNATFFDLIEGETETKQTKGLAYLLYADKALLFDFLNSDMMRDAVQKRTGKKVSAGGVRAVTVSAEKYTVDRKRADIVIRIAGKAGPLLAVIIEAKSINGDNVTTRKLERQIKDNYLAEGKFPDLRGCSKLGVALTRERRLIDGVVSITWDQLINFLAARPSDPAGISAQYVEFVTHTGGTMKFYDEEVASLPAGKTFDLIKKYRVHSCRLDNKSGNFKKSLFITFREKGGFMSTLYKLEQTIILNPADMESLKDINIDSGRLGRITGYIKEYPSVRGEPFAGEDRLFFVLSTDENIDLPVKIKTDTTIRGLTYRTLKEMFPASPVL